jgi:LPS-assembly protein
MRRIAVFALALVLSVVPAFRSEAQTGGSARPDPETPALFKADRVRHDRDLGLVIATGNVEVTHGARILLADTLTYNQRTDTVSANGNVRLLDPSGDVMFADFMELSGDLKNGIAETIRVRLSDNSRLAAVGARRIGGVRTELRKAVYTPCLPCKEHPERPPIWQVKAFEVVHDQERQEIEYYDAFLEFMGVPVMYLPYLSHPDPTVKRKTGFLVPSYGGDGELGGVIRVPYFINISPTQDATLTPIVTTKEGLALLAEYRNRFSGGLFVGDGSVTYATKEDGTDGFRGHFDGRLNVDIDDTWRGGLKIDLTSDDTYLRRYGLGSDDTLTSRAFVEGFRRRSYAAANAYYFQGLRAEDDAGETPIIHPIADFNYIGEPGRHGGRWSLDSNMLLLTRTDGTDSRRLSLKTGWQLPYTSAIGEVYTLFANLQTDAYFVDDVKDPGNPDNTLSGFTGRIFPQIGLDWRYPFVRNDGRFSQLIEPIAGVIVAPNGGNPDKVPNEDSIDFEFDDTNVFRATRFTGLDRVEGGQRAYYGVKGAVYGPGGGSLSAFIGQSYRVRQDSTFAEGSGLDKNFSHFVGRVGISPGRLVDILYRFRIDNEDFTPKRNEVSASIGPPALNLKATYLFIDQQGPTDEFPDRQEIKAAISSKLTSNWSFAASTRRNLEPDGGALNYRMNLDYVDDCFTFGVSYTKTFTEDRDVRPTETIFFKIQLKNLGGGGAAAP